MKTLLLAMAAVMFCSCTVDREIEANIMSVELVRIDTIQRYPNYQQKLLTWNSENNIRYITYEPMSSAFTLGSKMKVMMRK